ncbi:CAAX prenyl protease 2-like [Uloborus diversus]|uniref:CAAX prenyl protease 2-like n=1 Tax=Uloborus diversus TaxID=327109 RepID=UPI00240A99AE|nr:CAAX prenyl protease 2-like [Uloborus diversus]
MINKLFIGQMELGCFPNVILCIFLATIYVGSLYIWRNTHSRDHPTTIKKRFLSVFLISFVSAIFVYIFADRSYFGYDHNYWSLLGIRVSGVLQAIFLPLILTMILFMGPISVHYNDGIYNKFFDFKLWLFCLTNVIWLRNHVIAPFFEEFTFRACMLPILVPCFGDKTSVILCPFFFGIAHLHLLNEKLAHGAKFKVAILQSLFQFAYTTVFGAYSTYLFLRTGHVAAPFIVHAFCNHMGFPDFGQLLSLEQPKKAIFMSCFAAGLFLWIMLLNPLTEPQIYNNSVYWSKNSV